MSIAWYSLMSVQTRVRLEHAYIARMHESSLYLKMNMTVYGLIC